jgi:hypothetical protein
MQNKSAGRITEILKPRYRLINANPFTLHYRIIKRLGLVKLIFMRYSKALNKIAADA